MINAQIVHLKYIYMVHPESRQIAKIVLAIMHLKCIIAGNGGLG